MSQARGSRTNKTKKSAFEAKVILLGESGVGKSSLAYRFTQDQFNERHDVTIGAAYLQQTITLPDSQQVKLHIWDTGGSDRFRSMVSLYYKDVQAALICYDITNEASTDSVLYWIDQMQRNCNTENFTMALVGTKLDALETKKRMVNFDKMIEIAEQHNMLFNETSSRTGEGISELFLDLAKQIAEKQSV